MRTVLGFILLFWSFVEVGAMAQAEDKLVIYSSRKDHLVRPLFEAYEKETGIKIEFLTDKDAALVQKLKAEADKTPADLLMTVDAGNLYLAQKQGLLASVESKTLTDNIPPHLRDPENHWFGLSIRARPIFYDSRKVKKSELSSYKDLANKKWQGKLCLRTSKKVYNQSLVAMMLTHRGQKQVEATLKGWVENLAAPVFSSDTKLLEAIESGQCQVGIANSYYYGRLLRDEKVNSVKIFWPNQDSTGAHVNISGAAIVKASDNKARAKEFLVWLSKPKAQELLAGANLEYPVNPEVKVSSIVKGFGEFVQDKTNLKQAGVLQTKAVILMDKAGYQ